MEPALIYHYWSDRGGPVGLDFKNPLILSMATFRKFNRTSRIYVIDTSKKQICNDWGDWPGRIGFEVHRREHALYKIEGRCVGPNGIHMYHRLLSKPATIYDFSNTLEQPIIIFSDSDLMWVKNPFPLEADYTRCFCANHNTGFFYYDRSLPLIHKVFDLWTAFCTQACVNNQFCQRVSKVIGTEHMHDETILNYIQRQYPECFSAIPVEENCPFGMLARPEFNRRRVKALHIHCNNFNRYPHQKSLACICLKELYDITKDMIGEEEMNKMFSGHNIVPTSMYDHERMAWLNERDQ